MSLTSALRSRLGGDTTHADPLPEDDLFEILSSPRRRFAINILAHVDGPVTVDLLARTRACYESDDADSVRDVSSQARKRNYVSLYQTHLPKLEEYGVIERVGDHAVRSTARCHHLAAVIEAAREANDA